MRSGDTGWRTLDGLLRTGRVGDSIADAVCSRGLDKVEGVSEGHEGVAGGLVERKITVGSLGEVTHPRVVYCPLGKVR